MKTKLERKLEVTEQMNQLNSDLVRLEDRILLYSAIDNEVVKELTKEKTEKEMRFLELLMESDSLSKVA